MLDGVEDAIDARAQTGLYKATGCFRDGPESLHYCFRIQTQMCDQQIVACKILGLCQRTEDRLEQGSLRSKLGADEAQAIQLSGQVRNRWLKVWQIFPIPRLVDDAPGITTSPFSIPDPFI